jgi:hypothetical protein
LAQLILLIFKDQQDLKDLQAQQAALKDRKDPQVMLVLFPDHRDQVEQELSEQQDLKDQGAHKD